MPVGGALSVEQKKKLLWGKKPEPAQAAAPVRTTSGSYPTKDQGGEGTAFPNPFLLSRTPIVAGSNVVCIG